MNRRLKNFIIRRLVVILVSWLPASSHSFGIERTDDAALRHIRQAPLNSLASRSSLVSLESGRCSKAILQRQYDRVVSRRPDAAQVRIA
ncbi:hypothetical protein AAFX91_04220 [Bradyrhizobium sp. 31Argb]|nr:hypothetical protein [Bradyrhizobium sp. Arg237L]MDI4237679.1 hypothetical protein [Bradyrhizobium sp. Arg237L]